MTSHLGLQTLAIWPKSKGNQTMRFGQLIEHNERNMQEMGQGD